MDKKHNKLDAYNRILDAAAHNFSQVGYAGARMEEIANQAGVNKASIYYHVGDKKALYQEVLSKVISVTADRIAENIETHRVYRPNIGLTDIRDSGKIKYGLRPGNRLQYFFFVKHITDDHLLIITQPF